MENKFNCYEDLFKKVKEWNKSHQGKPLTICPAICGQEYGKDPIHKPMFVGRSINGWCPLDGCEDGMSFLDRLHKCELCGLGWVVGKENWTHCRENNCQIAMRTDAVDGRINNTPFWQMVKYICEIMYPDFGENWYKRILWSNLYKASFVFGENPKGFYEEQIRICNEILIKEIHDFQPSEIYFITETNRRKKGKGRSWFCEEYSKDVCFREVYKYLKDNKWENRVVVLKRPEFHNKARIWDQREGLKERE